MMIRFPRVDHTDHGSSSPIFVESMAVSGPSFSVLCLSAIAASVVAVSCCVGSDDNAPSAFSRPVFCISIVVIERLRARPRKVVECKKGTECILKSKEEKSMTQET